MSSTVEMWLAGRPAATQRAYAHDVADFFSSTGRRELRDVTLPELQRWEDALRERYPGDRGPTSTVKRKVSAVKSLFGFAQRLGLIDRNPAAALRVPRAPRALGERILDQEDVLGAIHRSRGKRHTILRVFYATGARVSELAGLRWIDVRAVGDRGIVTVYGKGAKIRAILISAGTYTELIRLRGAAGEMEPVFTGQKGAAISARQLERIVKAEAIAAGLSERVSPHWFRHAHASHALERGAPVHLVAATLGHSSITTTGEYAHARPSDSSALYLPV